MSTNFSSSLPTKLLTVAIYEKCSQSFLIELKIYVSFNSKKKLKSANQKQKTADNWYFGSIAAIQCFYCTGHFRSI